MNTSPIGFQHGSSRDFLPSFLTGESQQLSSLAKALPPTTPERRQRLSMPFSAEPMPPSPEKRLPQEKEEPIGRQGPPTSGIGRVNENNALHLFPMSPVGGQRSLNNSTGFILSVVPTPKSNTMRSSFGGGKGLTGSSSCVTVFGFTSSSSPSVLAHFSQFGTILEWKTNPGSNWIHLNYSNAIEARRALQKNGTVISGTTMVGVSSCTEEMAREGLPPGASSFFQSSPLSKSPPDNLMFKENVSPPKGNATAAAPILASGQMQPKSRMRSMGRDTIEMQLPQQKKGILSWALDTIFGW